MFKLTANNNSVEAMITNIVNVVFRIHFYYITNYDLEQDLKQEGYLKAYELLAEGNYDPNKNLRTFIYTGVRNAMTNYIYHHKKENHVDLETISTSTWQSYEEITSDDYWRGKVFTTAEDEINNYDIDVSIVTKICNKYIMFGDYTNVALKELSNLGVYSKEVGKILIKPVPFVKDAIMGEILWNIFRK